MSLRKPVSRRRFMKKAGVLAGAPLAAGLSAASLGNVLQANEYLRLGWIGVGGRGTSLLRRALESVSVSTLKVAAICDINEAHQKRGIDLCGGMKPAGIYDYRDLLDRKDVDAVFIATPIYLHRDHAVAVMQAGKHAYCEKPLGRNPREVKDVYDAVKRSSKKFQVGFQWRYQEGFKAFVDVVQGGQIGKVNFVDAHRHVGGYPTSGWYVDRNLSGDLIVEQAVHEMNVFCWLLKSHPLRAAGFGGINELRGVPEDRTIMDHYALTYEFPHDITLRYSHCVYTPNGFGGLDMNVYGSDKRGAALEGTTKLYVTKSGKRAPVELEPWGDATAAAIQHFAKSIREDKEPLCNVDAGRVATLMAILGRTAIHERRVVEWDEVAV